ncbi:MAG: succinate dehydrogenase [Pseudomonadota bacterium]
MLRNCFLILPLVALSACDTAIGTEVTRETAKGVVNRVVQQEIPGAPVEPVTDCIIDNSSGSEIIQIGSDALSGQPSTETVELVIQIALREGTINCFIEDAGPVVVPQILASIS